MTDKIKIRQKGLKARKTFSSEERAAKNRRILNALSDNAHFKAASHILLYYSCNGEVDTTALIDQWIDSKQLYLPVIRGKSHFQAIPIKKPLDLKAGFEKVPEPTSPEPNSLYDKQVELIIIPGVAFDQKGNRIGMGKGYYDRYLKVNNKAYKIALAYSEQVLDSVPKDQYDVSVDMVITDQKVYQC